MYETYTSLVELLQARLGISVIDWQEYPELEDELIHILSYVNSELAKLGSDAEIKEKLDRIFEIHEEGTKLIIEHNMEHSEEGVALGARDLYEEVMSASLTTLTEYKLSKFIFCWADFFGSLCTRLRIMYSALYYQPVEQGCPCLCGRGEHQSDWENYTSGIYPADENSDGNVCDITNAQFTSSVSDICGCSYRK